MDTKISDYEVLTETKQNKSLTSCPRRILNSWARWSLSSSTTWLSSVRSLQSRMLSLLSETKCPQWRHSLECGHDTFRNHQVQMRSMLLTVPLPFCQQCSSCHDPSYHGFLQTGIPSRNVRFSKSPTGHPSWRPQVKTPGLSKVWIFSISGKTGSILNRHPVSKLSFVPPPSSEWSEKVWPSSLVLKEWISVVQVSPCRCLAQEMKRHQTNTKVTLKKIKNNKPKNPNHKLITVKMGWSILIGC